MKVHIPSKEERQAFERAALKAITGYMVFEDGMRFHLVPWPAGIPRFMVRLVTDDVACPVVAWGRTAWNAGKRGGLHGDSGWLRASQLLGLDRAVAWRIVGAADHTFLHNPEIRRALLKRCGLEEAFV